MTGELCGSSFINERYQKLLESKLKDEKYLEANGVPLSRTIHGIVKEFEERDKKRMDEMTEPYFRVMVSGLRANKALRFRAGELRLSR